MIIKHIKTHQNLKEHKNDLDKVYGRMNFSQRPWGYNGNYIEYTRESIHRPIAENLMYGSVLDAGGGYGFFRRYTHGHFHVNVDLSEKILKHDSGFPKILSSIENMPFKDNVYDNIVSIGVLRHCYDPEEFIREAYRILKEDGKLLISTPSSDWPQKLNFTFWGIFTLIGWIENTLKRITSSFAKIPFKKKFVNYDRRYSFADLRKIVEQNDFVIEKMGRSGKEFPSSVHPPRFLVDRLFDSDKYGRFLFVVCKKNNLIS